MAQVLESKLDSLDALAEQIDRAADAIVRLKSENAKLKSRLGDLEAKLSEVDGLRAAEKLWTTERKEIGHRIEELVKKLERLDG
jgi:BMFP domain-containing protein YqiC